jgi:hypothetical protein
VGDAGLHSGTAAAAGDLTGNGRTGDSNSNDETFGVFLFTMISFTGRV